MAPITSVCENCPDHQRSRRDHRRLRIGQHKLDSRPSPGGDPLGGRDDDGACEHTTNMDNDQHQWPQSPQFVRIALITGEQRGHQRRLRVALAPDRRPHQRTVRPADRLFTRPGQPGLACSKHGLPSPLMAPITSVCGPGGVSARLLEPRRVQWAPPGPVWATGLPAGPAGNRPGRQPPEDRSLPRPARSAPHGRTGLGRTARWWRLAVQDANMGRQFAGGENRD